MTYVGAAVSRVDGRAKVTGEAKYAAEFTAPVLVHGWVVASTVARGRITHIDRSAALAVAGVLDVLTHTNRPSMASEDAAYKDDVAPDGSPFRPLYDDRVWFDRQPVALVLAEEPEIACHAASLVVVSYEQELHTTDMSHPAEAIALPSATDGSRNPFAPPRPRGSPEPALAAAPVQHAGEYSVPIEHHNPMELFAATVLIDPDGRLTVHDKTQGVQNVQRYLCSVFGMAADEVRVVSPFVGGAFGSGLRPQYEAVLAVLGARAVRRPVRVVLTRAQMYGLGYRPAMRQRIGLGAGADGQLAAITHDAVTITSRYEEFHRQETGWSGLLYRCANARYAHSLARLDLPTPCDMRAPSAAPALFALESAMDELAVALRLDPLELRLRCYSERDQHADLPYSSKRLRECYRQGAEAFGWSKRNPAPRSMRDGSDLVGWGMATGAWEALQVPIAVRIVLTADGHAEIACATSDIGTGTYTIMSQVAADVLGLPLDSITIRLGDSSLPQAPVEGGSWIAASVANAIVTTGEAIRTTLLRLAQSMPGSPLAGAVGVVMADGQLRRAGERSGSVPVTDVMRHAGLERIEEERLTKFENDGSEAHNTHSAIFAEVNVDEQLGIVRVTRVVSALAAGRVLNAKTATSQIIGGVVWGIGMALHEETLVDHRFGRIMNANIAEYHVPTYADVHDIEVIFVDEPDERINRLGIKGLGEIGIVGVAAAIANAVYHATGVRMRELPMTVDKLLSDESNVPQFATKVSGVSRIQACDAG